MIRVRKSLQVLTTVAAAVLLASCARSTMAPVVYKGSVVDNQAAAGESFRSPPRQAVTTAPARTTPSWALPPRAAAPATRTVASPPPAPVQALPPQGDSFRMAGNTPSWALPASRPAASQPAAAAPKPQPVWTPQPAAPAQPILQPAAQPVPPPVPPAPAVAAPKRVEAPSDFVGGGFAVVEPGDTVYAVARRAGLPIKALIQANGLKAPYRIGVGNKLRLPRVRLHTVAPGETLFRIAKSYDVDTYELAKFNGIGEPFTVPIGNRLAIPAAYIAATVPADSGGTQSAPPPAQSVALNAPPAPSVATPTGPLPKARRAALPVPPRIGKFTWPVANGRVISRFGVKRGGLHNDGINIAVPRGAPIKAAENGVVAYVGNELPGFGNLVLIKHRDGYTTTYAHSDAVLVKRGQQVKRGQVIAKAGSTGSVDRPQLHFEIRRGSQAIDPAKFLDKSTLAGSPRKVSLVSPPAGRPSPG